MDDKQKFRKKSIQRLKSAQYKPGLSFVLQKQVEKIIKRKKARVILFYLPMAFEPDLVKLMQKLRRDRVVLVPFMEGISFKTVQYRLPLKKARFNIAQPGDSMKFQKKIDIAIVPVVGIDCSKKRVGFGKGMYDRFFDRLHYKPYTVFIQTVPCISKKKITNHYDVQADHYITARKSLQQQGLKSVFRDSYSGACCRG